MSLDDIRRELSGLPKDTFLDLVIEENFIEGNIVGMIKLSPGLPSDRGIRVSGYLMGYHEKQDAFRISTLPMRGARGARVGPVISFSVVKEIIEVKRPLYEIP